MANEIRLRSNNIAGTITDNPLTNVATTINSPGFVDLPVVDATSHLILILDPLELNGPAEIVRVTAHTAAASVVTVTRGAEGSAARSHAAGTTWFHGPVATDYRDLYTSSARPTVPYTGMEILETDTLRNMQYTGTTWQQNGLYWDPPACRVFDTTGQSIPNNTDTALTFNSERYDTDNMHDLVNPTRITFRTAGIYTVTSHIQIATATDYSTLYMFGRINGTTLVGIGPGNQPGSGVATVINCAFTYKAAVNDYAEILVRQNNGATAARAIIAGLQYSPEVAATWIGRGN